MTQLAESYAGQPSYKQLNNLQDPRLQELWNYMLLPHLSSLFKHRQEKFFAERYLIDHEHPWTPDYKMGHFLTAHAKLCLHLCKVRMAM